MQGFTKDIPIDNDGTLSANSDFIVPSQKAVKTYVDAADALKANLASPALTGSPTAPTQTANTNNTTLATTAYVDTAISTVSSPASKLYLFNNFT